MKEDLDSLIKKLKISEDGHILKDQQLKDSQERLKQLTSQLENEKNKNSNLESTLKEKEKELIIVQTEIKNLKEDKLKTEKVVQNQSLTIQSLKDINTNLNLKIEEMKNGVLLIKEENLVKDLEDGFTFLKNLQIDNIDFKSVAEIKRSLNDTNVKIHEYSSIWREEFELIKNFFIELVPLNDVNDATIVQKISRYFSLLKKLRASAEIEELWKKKSEELKIKVQELKNLFD